MYSPSLRQFLREIGANWVTAVSGVLSILLMASSFYVSGETLRSLFVGAALVGLLWAAYRVWLGKAQALEKELESHQKPVVKAQLEELLVRVYAPEQLQGSATCDMEVLLKATVHNESECSGTIRCYDLVVEDADGIHHAEPLSPADLCVIERGEPQQDSSRGVVGSKIERPNDLVKETVTSPLVRGVHRFGWLHFKVPDINPKSAETALYSLSAIDAFGQHHNICRSSPTLGVGYFKSPD